MCLPGLARHPDLDLAQEGGTAGLARSAGGLSGRQIEVLRLVAAGLSNAEIAGRLVVEVSTVGSHLTQLSRHFGVSRRALIANARQILAAHDAPDGAGPN